MKTYKQHIKKLNKKQFEQIKSFCFHSNSLYNCSLYITRQFFFETNKYIGYNELYKQLKDNIHYKSLPSKIAQQTIRLMDKDFRSFFGLLNLKKNGNYQDKINIPYYKKKNQEFILILPNDQVSFKNNYIKITKEIKLKFTKNIDGKIKQVIINPKYNKYYEINIQYEPIINERKINYDLNNNNYLSIDLGLNNFASCFSNIGHSFILNGKVIKSYNQYYNKRKAELQAKIKIINNKNWSKSLSKLTIKRNNKINDYLNKSVNIIIKYCLRNKIKNIVIGYNEGWKQEVNLGKVTNQKFVGIPYNLFKQKIENKCKEYEINYSLQEESYTSKCSALDLEEIGKHETYLGKRIKRGLFQTSTGKKINADINGSINILRRSNEKVISKSNINEIEGFIVSPLKLNPVCNKQEYFIKLY